MWLLAFIVSVLVAAVVLGVTSDPPRRPPAPGHDDDRDRDVRRRRW